MYKQRRRRPKEREREKYCRMNRVVPIDDYYRMALVDHEN